MLTLGRSHFITAADALVRGGANLDLLQGWVPTNLNSWLVKLCKRMIKRESFVAGLEKRRTPALEGHIISEPVSEFIQTALLLTMGRLNCRLNHAAVGLGFSLHGFLARRHFEGYDVFHVKSGLGRGGAIRDARRRGLKVLVDQGIAHPSWLSLNLRQECENTGAHYDVESVASFWRLVLRDCRDADLLMVNSEFVRDTFVQHGYNEKKVRVVRLGVRPDFVGLRSWQVEAPLNHGAPLRILFTGGFNARKGAKYFLDAIREISRRGIKASVTLVGSYHNAIPLIEKYGDIRHVLKFIGHVSQDVLKNYLREADVYLFPSLAEGCAQSGMEAMAASLCVIATRESGLPITDGQTGYIVPARNVESIADRLEWLVAHPHEIQRVGCAASKLIYNTFTWEKYAKNVKNVYSELINE